MVSKVRRGIFGDCKSVELLQICIQAALFIIGKATCLGANRLLLKKALNYLLYFFEGDQKRKIDNKAGF